MHLVKLADVRGGNIELVLKELWLCFYLSRGSLRDWFKNVLKAEGASKATFVEDI